MGIIKKYEIEELELDEQTIVSLKELAEKNNTTIDTVVSDILIYHISKKVTIDEFKEILNRNDHEEISGHYFILDNENNPIAQIIPARD